VIALIIALTVSLTLNIIFVVTMIYLRSKSLPSAPLPSSVSMVNLNVGTEIPQSKPVPPKTVDIYTFIDPNTNRVKYVGQSVDVQKRIGQHIRDAITSGAKAKWILDLHAQGQLPIVRIVASGLAKKEANTFEKRLIRDYISSGEKLLNRESLNPVPEIMNRIQIEGPAE
jgi:GIY-YIG catalytic domain